MTILLLLALGVLLGMTAWLMLTHFQLIGAVAKVGSQVQQLEERITGLHATVDSAQRAIVAPTGLTEEARERLKARVGRALLRARLAARQEQA